MLDVCFQDNWLYIRALFDALPGAVSKVYGGYVCRCEEGARCVRSLPREKGDMASRKLAGRLFVSGLRTPYLRASGRRLLFVFCCTRG